MTAVGFEPTRIAPPELESGALDRSAKLTTVAAAETLTWNLSTEVPEGRHSLSILKIVAAGISRTTTRSSHTPI